MKELIENFTKWLTVQVMKPVKAWIAKAPWIFKLLLLFIALLLLAYISFPSETRSRLELGWYSSRALIAQGNGKIPLTSGQNELLQNEMEIFKKGIRVQLQEALASRDTNGFDPWTIAQMVAGARDLRGVDLTTLEFMGDLYEPNGEFVSCCRNDGPVQIAAWHCYAWAKANQGGCSNEIAFLINSQVKNDGGWALFKVGPYDRAKTSTYSTAICVMALNEEIQSSLIPDNLKESANKAVDQGAIYLQGARNPSGGWFDYYNMEHQRIEMDSMSALALHVLHLCDRKQRTLVLDKLDEHWLDNLPTTMKPVTFHETSGTTIVLPDRDWRRDGIRHYPLPWMVMATVDAYKNGTLLEKAKALKWLNSFFHALPDYDTSVGDLPWLKAEIAMSLEYLSENSF